VSPSPRVQLGKLARRSIARTLRQPVLIVPNFVFPLFMLAVVSAGAGDQATKVEGFPTDNYTTFLLGATLIQGASGAMTMAGNALGTDIVTGFLNRLSLTPISASTLIVAQLAGVAVLGVAQSAIYILVALAAGANIETGLAGAAALIAVVLLIVVSFGSIGLFAAVRAGSPERVQALVAVALGLLFLSSMVMPRDLITEDWFQTIATYNPLSYLVEAPRSLLVSGWDGEALALGCGIAAGIAVLALAAASATLKRKVSKT
jgi:ABC-2 type transport system permease protein